MWQLLASKFFIVAFRLEKESRVFFNCSYISTLILNGQWSECESYFSAFTSIDDNRHSMKCFFEIRKQRYLEALERFLIACYILYVLLEYETLFFSQDIPKAVQILKRDLSVFQKNSAELFSEMAMLLTLDNIRCVS